MLPLRRLPGSTVLRRPFSTSPTSQHWPALRISPEITSALASSTPIVALETAIVTHGLPSPLNIQTALKLEAIIRSHGAVPATIGVLDGVPCVGMTEEMLVQVADKTSSGGKGPCKVSRRDLAPSMALRRNGGTTVAGTMYIARQAGIDMFVTGGIGGVHRGGETSLDVSADLTELGRTPMAVVCAGAKSILDLGRTLEFLETQGVTVATYGPTTDFPAFYSQKSGFQSPWNVDSLGDAASLIHTGLTLPTPLSTLLAVPIPDEFQAAGAAIQAAVEQAVVESLSAGIVGKEMTPWLLARVGQLTEGRATKSNLALIENNAHVGAKIAVQLAQLKQEQQLRGKEDARTLYGGATLGGSDAASTLPLTPPTSPTFPRVPIPSLPPPTILVIGSAAVDVTAQPHSTPTSPSSVLGTGTTHPGRVAFSPGGVGLNVALCASRLSGEGEVMLVAPVADDALGGMLAGMMGGLGLRTDGLRVAAGEERTASCNLVLGKEGDLDGGVADMGIVEGMKAEEITSLIDSLPSPPRLLAVDGNLSPDLITSLLIHARSKTPPIPTFFEPTSLAKSLRFIFALKASPMDLELVSYISPNLLELRHIHAAMDKAGLMESDLWWKTVDSLGLGSEWRDGVARWGKKNGVEWLAGEGVIQTLVQLTPFFPTQLVKLGSRGVVSLRRVPTNTSTAAAQPSTSTMTHSSSTATLHLTFHPPTKLSPEEIVSSTGAGDSLVGAVIAGLGTDASWEAVVERGQRAARESLRSGEAVGRGVGVGEGWGL